MPRDADIRAAWAAYKCQPAALVRAPFGPDRVNVAPGTQQAWSALAAVFDRHGYKAGMSDPTWSYACRNVRDGDSPSLHSYGLALDVNATANPLKKPIPARKALFSTAATQAERASDVYKGRADTDMTRQMVEDVEKIRTKSGATVFEWGGRWVRLDCMHFQIECFPNDLAAGVDWSTVIGSPPVAAAVNGFDHVVIARTGLNLRPAPDIGVAPIRPYPAGTPVRVLSRRDEWALVDLSGDGLADGFMSADYLEPV